MGIKGGQAAKSAPTSTPGAYIWPTLAASPLEHHLKSSGSSMTPARLTCGWPLSTAEVPPAVSACPHPSCPPQLSPSLASDRYGSLVLAAAYQTYDPKMSTTFRFKWRKFNLYCGFAKITGVLASETVQVMGEPGAESRLALGATTDCKIDAGPARRDSLSESPLVAGHMPSRALSLGSQRPC